MTATDFLSAPGPQVVAHRGASATAPENTLAAYRLAIAQGARAAECDVHLSRDGQVVVLHDATVDRTTDGVGAVRDLDLAALRRLDAGAWKGAAYRGERIPELGELLDAITGELVLFLELKGGDAIDARVAEAVAAHGAADRVVLLSFDHELLARTCARLPGAPAMALHDAGAAPHDVAIVDLAVAAGFRALGLRHEGVTQAVVERAHARGLVVYAWTVDDERSWRRLCALAVDGIITNRPAWALALAGLPR